MFDTNFYSSTARGVGIYATGVSLVTLRNCTIVGNRNTNTGTETASCGGGLYVSGTDAQIFNNVIYDNQNYYFLPLFDFASAVCRFFHVVNLV